MRLYMIEIAVADLGVSLAWYRDRLRLPVLLLDEPNRFALLDAGDAKLALKQGRANGGSDMIVLQVDDLDAELKRLMTQGIAPDGPIKMSEEGYRQAFVRDPDGRRVSLFEWIE